MNKFIEIPSNLASISMRKLVYGVGINDADYKVQPNINGKKLHCKFYTTWKSMLCRCYDNKYKEKYKTYIDCTVIKEWHTFSNFKKWMQTQDWKNKHLDKDILSIGNKIYSPENCVFITGGLNNLLNDHKSKRGLYPIGVYLYKKTGKFKAQCRFNGERKHLGYYDTVEKASNVYLLYKSKLIINVANEHTNERVKESLLLYTKELLYGNL